MTHKSLLLVSGVIDPERQAQIEAGARPRADYFEIAREIGADILDYGEMRRAQSPISRLLDKISPNLALAWAAWRRQGRYRLIFSDGEQVGIPLAALFKLSKRVQHMMIVHVLSVRKKLMAFDLLRLQGCVGSLYRLLDLAKAIHRNAAAGDIREGTLESLPGG